MSLILIFVLCCFEIYQTMAAADANPSFLFNGGFVKSPSFDENIALFGDSKFVDGGPSIQLTDSVSRSEGRVVYRQPIDSSKQHNTELVVGMVRQQFKKHMNETDPEKIQKLKDDAARGLINHMLFESAKLTGGKVSQRS